MANNHLELYTDYLTVSFSQATATGLSAMLDGDISHDQITQFLSGHDFTSKDLWRYVKSTVRKVEEGDAVLIFDDCIQEKQWTDENEIMCWHYDHCAKRSVRGINLLNCLYYSGGISIPVAFEIVRKPVLYCDVETHNEKRRANITKNALMLQMLDVACHNQLKFRYVLMDIWFSSSSNMTHIKTKKGKNFICAIKSNRHVAVSGKDKKNGGFTRIDTLEWPEDGAVKGWLKGVKFPVMLTRKIFKNKDGSTGTLYLACSDPALDGADIWTVYKKRWKVEEFHKSLKQNAALAKSPTRLVKTQSNHIFSSIIAVFKLECLKMKQGMNHFALKGKLYIKAITAAYQELQTLKFA